MSTDSGRFITEYFPSIPTMRLMLQRQHIEMEYDETFQKNSLRNRCYLASSQGARFISVPLVKGKHQQQPIRQVRIAYDENWPLKHLRCIETNYSKAPFYSHYIDEVRQILYAHPIHLIELNWSIMQFLSSSFQWNPCWSCSLEHGQPLNQQGKHHTSFRPYPQVFEDKLGFLPNLSVLDLLFCIGPQPKYIGSSNTEPD